MKIEYPQKDLEFSNKIKSIRQLNRLKNSPESGFKHTLNYLFARIIPFASTITTF